MLFSSLHPGLTLATVSCEDPFWFLAQCISAALHYSNTWNTKRTHWWWMCSEVALWSAKWKKWDVLRWRSGTIRHFGQAKPFWYQKCLLWGGAPQSCETQADSSEAVIWVSSLPLVMNPTGAKVTEECRRRKRDDLGGMKTATIEGRQTYCIVYLFSLFFYHCAIVHAKILIFRTRHQGWMETEYLT